MKRKKSRAKDKKKHADTRTNGEDKMWKETKQLKASQREENTRKEDIKNRKYGRSDNIQDKNK